MVVKAAEDVSLWGGAARCRLFRALLALAKVFKSMPLLLSVSVVESLTSSLFAE